jgi:hypothetical protein
MTLNYYVNCTYAGYVEPGFKDRAAQHNKKGG